MYDPHLLHCKYRTWSQLAVYNNNDKDEAGFFLRQLINLLNRLANAPYPASTSSTLSHHNKEPHDHRSCVSTIPTAPFQSPFIGRSHEQLKEHFIKELPEPEFTAITFVVLDERTKKDDTCCIVSISEGLSTARSDFFVALEVLTPIDVRAHELSEALGSSCTDTAAGTGFLHTKEKMIELMGPENSQRRYWEATLARDKQEPYLNSARLIGPDHPSRNTGYF